MKKQILMSGILVLAMFFILQNVSLAYTVMGDRIVLSEEDNGKTALMQIGQVVEVLLPSNPTTGYDWQVADSSEKAKSWLVGQEFVRQGNVSENMTGVGGYTIMYFKPTVAGILEIPLVYKRSWEKDTKPENVFMLKLVAGDGSFITSESNNSVVHVKKGKELIAVLPSNPTTGYEWYWDNSLKKNGLKETTRVFIAQSNTGLVGAKGTLVLFMSATKTGVFDLELENMRSWEGKSSVSEKIKLKLVVSEEK